MTSGYVDVNGLDLYYEREGTGFPLVLLHGALGTIEGCFADLRPRLAEHHDVVAVELQGHGHTADLDRPLRYQTMAADVAGLLAALAIPRADVVGYSMGGAIGLQLALDRPDVVQHLVFAGGAAYDTSGLHAELTAMVDDFDPHAVDGTAWHDASRRVAPDPGSWATLVAKVNQLDRDGFTVPPDRVAALSMPTLLVIGDADLVRPEHTVEMFRLLGGGVAGDLVGLPRAQLAVLPGTTHVGLLERVDWLAAMIGAFLDHE